MVNFLPKWYQTHIQLSQISDVFAAWIDTNWGDTMPSLVFTRPQSDFTPFWPPRAVEVVGTNADNTVELRFEIENGITDPWYETAEASALPKLVKDFLRINSEEDRIYITLGPHIDWWKRIR